MTWLFTCVLKLADASDEPMSFKRASMSADAAPIGTDTVILTIASCRVVRAPVSAQVRVSFASVRDTPLNVVVGFALVRLSTI